MTSWVRDLLSRKTEKEKAKAKLALNLKKEKEEICKRQSALLRKEVVLEWRMVFGNEVPKKKKDTYLIKNVTRRNVWMEPGFLFDQIKAFQPENLFHALGKYALQWQPRGSLFRLVIPLDDPQVQENAIIIMSKWSREIRKRTLFFFGPIDPGMEMYAPKVHPASLVSYRTKNEVLKKLCDYFLIDKISVQEIQAVLMCDQYVWSATLFNLLPADEQVYHLYLNEQKPLEDTKKSLAKSYIDGDITLSEYEDSKFPERKKLREIEAQAYPLPIEMGDCAICTQTKCGIVSCNTCDNMVCETCMLSIFSGRTGRKSISFLLMHQKYCMKLGELAPITPIVEDEPGYLRELRATSRAAALDLLLPKKEAEMMKEDELSEDEEEAEERRRAEEERLRLLAEESARLQRENPPALQAMAKQLESYLRKFDRISKDIVEYTEKSLDKTHTEMFIARNLRLRTENIEKLRDLVVAPVTQLQTDARALQLTGHYIDALLGKIADALGQSALLSEDLDTMSFEAATYQRRPLASVNTPSNADRPGLSRKSAIDEL